MQTTNDANAINLSTALDILCSKCGATIEELAMWVRYGELACYDAPTLTPECQWNYHPNEPRANRSHAVWNSGNGNCRVALGTKFFNRADVNDFNPDGLTGRWITYRALISQWTKKYRQMTEADIIELIAKKAREARAKAERENWMPMPPSVEDIPPAYLPADFLPPWNLGADLQEDVPLEVCIYQLRQVEAFERAFLESDTPELSSLASGRPSASKAKIIAHFPVFSDPEKNAEWWDRQMRAAKDIPGLLDCRVGEGKKGRGGSLWRPDLVAVWLEDPGAKGKVRLRRDKARAALKKFDGYEGVADELFPPER
jgi:hypothetical protein